MDSSEKRTKADKSGHIINSRQSQALELLLAGMNDREVAEAMGIRRQTVCAWRHRPDFITAFEARRLELWKPYAERLRSLIPRAVESIEWGMLKHRDMKLAFKLIDLVGLTEACRAGVGAPPPAIHEQVKDSEAWRRDREEHAAMLAEYDRGLELLYPSDRP